MTGSLETRAKRWHLNRSISANPAPRTARAQQAELTGSVLEIFRDASLAEVQTVTGALLNGPAQAHKPL
jgi:hypothetical protein